MPDCATMDPPPADPKARKREIARANLVKARERRWNTTGHDAGIVSRPADGATVQTPCASFSDAQMLRIAEEIAGEGPPQARLMALDRIAEWSGRRLLGESQAYKPDPARLAALDRAARAQMGVDLGERGAVVAVLTSAGSRVIRGDARAVVRELAGVLGVLDVLAKEAEKGNEIEGV